MNFSVHLEMKGQRFLRDHQSRKREQNAPIRELAFWKIWIASIKQSKLD